MQCKQKENHHNVLTVVTTSPLKEMSLLFPQLKKLGVMPPEQPLPPKCYRIYQIMWANNGDTISKQYAGTAALKVTFWSFAHTFTSESAFSQTHIAEVCFFLLTQSAL